MKKMPYEGYLILFALSDYIPVMDDTEVCLLLNGMLPVDQDLIDKWESLLQVQQRRLDKISEYAKSR